MAVNEAEQDVFARRRVLRISLFIGLLVVLVACSVLSLCVGQGKIPAEQIWDLLKVGPMNAETRLERTFWQVRVPRIALGLLVGACLGVAGALMQAVFANPLAEPSVIGVTIGAGVGAAIAIVFNIAWFGTSTIPIFAFVTALITAALVYHLARSQGQVRVVNLILTGIAVNAVAGALISALVFFAPTMSREQIIFWQMGSLVGGQWKYVSIVLTIWAIGTVVALFLSSRLDILALGDRAAGHVGENVASLRFAAIFIATLLTAGAVAYAGIIGFVGLIVPHIIRTITGPSNRILIPASALGGAALIEISDVAARTLIAHADLPIGIFTALVGGPTFFILLRRMMSRGRH